MKLKHLTLAGTAVAMIMLTDIRGLTIGFSEFADKLAALGKEKHLDIHAMHEDIFNTMHHV